MRKYWFSTVQQLRFSFLSISTSDSSTSKESSKEKNLSSLIILLSTKQVFLTGCVPALKCIMYAVVEFLEEETVAVSHLYWIETTDKVSFRY